MAHFAQLGDNNNVLNIVVVGDGDTADENGVEIESIGVSYLQSIFGADTNWAQTSWNTTEGVHRQGGTPFRYRYASIGSVYNADSDVFCDAPRYPSWSLDAEFHWAAPTPKPDDGHDYTWDEGNLTWEQV